MAAMSSAFWPALCLATGNNQHEIGGDSNLCRTSTSSIAFRRPPAADCSGVNAAEACTTNCRIGMIAAGRGVSFFFSILRKDVRFGVEVDIVQLGRA